MIDVGTVFPLAKDRLFVRLIVRLVPYGTVITTGDQIDVLVVLAVVAFAAGFSAAQLGAATPLTAVPDSPAQL
jgi:hypothetical protein